MPETPPGRTDPQRPYERPYDAPAPRPGNQPRTPVQRQQPAPQPLPAREPHYNDPWDVPAGRRHDERARDRRRDESRQKAPKRRLDPATYKGPEPKAQPQQYREYAEWGGIIVVAVIVALLVKAFIMQAFFIPSESMFPLLTEGDRVLVNKVAYKVGDIERGDVLVFNAPESEKAQNPEVTHLIKRVIGLPGDTVEARDGKLFVNGVQQVEPYIGQNETLDFDDPVTVGPGQLWMMGDNRENSQDSRFFGSIDDDLVVGRADLLLWPLSRLDVL
jgi:signal peptidase I